MMKLPGTKEKGNTVMENPIYKGFFTTYLQNSLKHGCTNPKCQVVQATKFCTQKPNVYKPSVWKLLPVSIV